MSKKTEFINYVNELLKMPNIPEMNEDASSYWNFLTTEKEIIKPTFTDNGKLILKHMKDYRQSVENWKAKDIAEGLLISSRTVSGAMRKLVTDGYVEKVSQEPVVYTLTTKGIEIEINNDEEEN